MQVQLLVRNVTSNIHVRSSSSSSKLIHSCVSMGVVATARHVTACAREVQALPSSCSKRAGAVRWAPRRRLHSMATTTEDLQTTAPVITLTPEAHKIVRDAIAQEPDPASLALWLEVRGVQEAPFIYASITQAVSYSEGGDAPLTQDEL